MKCFRVKADGQVVPFLNWTRMDGKAYVPVGGLRLPYLSVSSELVDLSVAEGRLERASLLFGDGRHTAELVRESADGEDALVVVPSGGFTFDRAAFLDVVPLDSFAARLAFLRLGEHFGAFPVCASLSACDRARRHVLCFDGHNLTFGPA